MARSRVEMFEAIRRDDRVEQLSVRALSDKYGVHRRTVRQALANAVPSERKTPVRVAPKLEPAKGLIDAMLLLDLTAPRKQRHTARRILARLVDEHELVDLTYSAVRDYVAKRRPEIWAAAGKGLEDAFVPQTHEPGAEGEVDFADLWIDLAGVRTKVFLFTMRLSFSGKAVHRAYATQGQEAFLEGHLAAFAVFGGTPMFHIRYDNLKAAVSRCCSAATAPSRPAGSRSVPTMASRRSTATLAWRGRTRRAVSRVRAAGSAATTWSRSRRSTRWPSSTRC